jgi:hypothetical protein
MSVLFTRVITMFISEKLFSKLIIMGLEKLAKSTKSTVDDEIVAVVKRVLGTAK